MTTSSSFRDDVDNVKAAIDIVDIISEYMTIKRAGSAFKGLCPFHKEKTPSFIVNPQRQSFHCFGCGEGGDVFSFVTKHEGMDFASALRLLAGRAGITLSYRESSPGERSVTDTLYKIHEQLADIYHWYLTKDAAGEEPRAYLKKRAIDQHAIESFKIGYAPPGGIIRQFGRRKKYSNDLLEQAGVLVHGENDYYDRFRDRIMFPINDSSGRVTGFSGRIMDASRSPAKYLNSPETPLFKKSRILYALDRARKSLVDQREALICEGQFDAIRCHMAGLTNVVAPQGTALTADQARILKRYVDSVVLLMDSDTAGQNAAIKASEVLIAEGLSVNVVQLPDGEDPDSIILKGGGAKMNELLRQAVSAIEFQVDILSSREDMADQAAVLRVSRAALNLISRSESAMQREQLLKLASRKLDISENALQQDLNRLLQKTRRIKDEPQKQPRISTRKGPPPQETALLEYMQCFPDVIPLIRDFLPLPCLQDPVCRKLASMLLERRNPDGLLSCVEHDDEEGKRLAAAIDAMIQDRRLPDDNPDDSVKFLILCLQERTMQEERERIRRKLAKASGPEAETLNLACRQLTAQLGALRNARTTRRWDDGITAILEVHSAIYDH